MKWGTMSFILGMWAMAAIMRGAYQIWAMVDRAKRRRGAL